jgi:hypothetical protein
MRRRLGGLMGAACGLWLAVGFTSAAADEVGLDRVDGPQGPSSAPVWPGMSGVEFADQPPMWWLAASKRDLKPTGADVAAASGDVGRMVVDGVGAIWVEVPWGLVRLDPATWSATVWDVGDDAAFVGYRFLRASAGSGVWLGEKDRVRLFDGVGFVRDLHVPPAYLDEAWEDDEETQRFEGIRDLVEAGSEVWIASEAGVARYDGRTWSMVGEGGLGDVEELQLSPGGEVWARSSFRWESPWTRYDGTRWIRIESPDVETIAWDPTGGIVAASEREVVRQEGSTWQVLLQLGDDDGEDDGEDIGVEELAASSDGTVWVRTEEGLLRSDDDGGWRSIATPEQAGGLGVSGDEVVVSSSSGVYRVAGDELELLWAPQQKWAAVPDIAEVISVSGDEAWIVVESWSEGLGAPELHLQRVRLGRPDPVMVARLAAVNAYWGWSDLALGAAAVAASDGAIWYVTEETVVRLSDGEKSVVARRPPGAGLVAGDDGAVRMVGTPFGKAVEQTLYGDGDIHCPDHWAHDLSLPVGQVRYRPTQEAIEITVTLTQAWPDTEYYVEVNTDDFCPSFRGPGPWSKRYFGLNTDRDGVGSLAIIDASGPGEHVVNVNVVATDEGGAQRADPRPREIGPDAFAELTVPTFADPVEGELSQESDWEGLCRLAADGQCTPADLPAPAQNITSMVAGRGGSLWVTVCPGGVELSAWGSATCAEGAQLMRWEGGWIPVPYPGADVTGLGVAPDGGFWAVLGSTTRESDDGILAHYREGSWTTFPELADADDRPFDHDAYAVTPAGSVCRILDEGPELVCVDESLRVSRTPVGLAGRVAVAADGTVWVEAGGSLARMPLTVP